MTDLRIIKNIDSRPIRYMGTQRVDPGETATVDIDNAAVRKDLRRHDAKYVFLPDVTVYRFLYDFAEQGGAVGDMTLTGLDGNAFDIPEGVIVTGAVLEVLEEMTTADDPSTVSIGVGDDLDAFCSGNSTASEGGGPLDVGRVTELFVGQWAGLGSPGNAPLLKTDSPEPVVMTVADEDLTGGKFVLHLTGIPATAV